MLPDAVLVNVLVVSVVILDFLKSLSNIPIFIPLLYIVDARGKRILPRHYIVIVK